MKVMMTNGWPLMDSETMGEQRYCVYKMAVITLQMWQNNDKMDRIFMKQKVMQRPPL